MTDTIYKEFYYPIIINARNRQNETLTLTFQSYDERVAKLILELQTENDTVLPLDGATVRFYLTFEMNGEQKSREVIGAVESIADQTISLAFPDDLKDFVGTITAGVYIDFNNGQKMDVRNLIFSVERSLIDAGDYGEVPEHYFESFQAVLTDVTNHGTTSKSSMDDKVSEVSAYADTKKSSMDSKVSEVNTYATTQKSAIDGIVSDIQTTGNTAKTQINQVLPSVQSKVAAINTELAKINENMPDLFVVYADNISGSGFSKTDSSKLYKGFSVKNSNLPADYRWERNVDRLEKDIKSQKTLGDNLIPNGYGEFKDNTNFSNYVFDGENSFDSKPSFRITASNARISIADSPIEIDISKAYEFSMNIKSEKGSPIFLGWHEYDIDGNRIYPYNVYAFSRSTTKLSKDLNDGDTVIYLDSTTGWVGSDANYQNGLIFWNYRDSTGYLYPEGIYSRNVWFDLYTRENVNKTNNTITLKSPWNHGTIPVGTRVSQSNDGADYKYRNFINTSVPTSWTNTSFRIGEDHQLQAPYSFDETRFSPAAKSIRLSTVWAYNQSTKDTYYINSIELKDIDNELMLLTANPINSILITLSGENPSTTLGGTWVQLGTESKFDSTIYYWKRTN